MRTETRMSEHTTIENCCVPMRNTKG